MFVNFFQTSMQNNERQLVTKNTRIPGALKIISYDYLNGKNKDTKSMQSTSTCQNIDSLV